MNMQLITAIAALLVLATAVEGSIDVRKFGAKGDGKSDDSKAIQKALDAAAKSGGKVELGVGRFKMNNPIEIPEGVTLEGVWEAPHHAQLTKGTVMEVYAGKGKEDGALITLNPSTCVKGITFFYPHQTIPPVAYPWTVQGKGMHGSVIDCTFVNSYKAIDFGTFGNELHYIRNCFGCPLKVGVHIDKCSDIGRIENVHFNPHYWMRSGAKNMPKSWEDLGKYLSENLVAFEFARTDWEYVFNTFCFGAKVGYRFYSNEEKGTVNGNFLGIGADWCGVAVEVEECQPPGLLITNGEFVGGPMAKAFVEVAPTNYGPVQFSNCSFWGPSETVLDAAGTGTTSFNQCTFHNHGKIKEKWTMDVKSGNLMVQGCRFGWDRPDIKLAKEVKTAVIMGNRFSKSKEIENNSSGDVQEGLNVVEK